MTFLERLRKLISGRDPRGTQQAIATSAQIRDRSCAIAQKAVADAQRSRNMLDELLRRYDEQDRSDER